MNNFFKIEMACRLLLRMVVREEARGSHKFQKEPKGELRQEKKINQPTNQPTNMKPHSSLPRCPDPLLFPRACPGRRRGRPLVAILLFLLLSLAGLSAQTFSNDCVLVVCPPKTITNYTCDDVFVPQTYPLIVSNKCPNVQVQVVCQPPPGTPLGLGSHPVQCDIRTATGQLLVSCEFTIVVARDVTPPQITCPNNLVVAACPVAGACGTTVFYPPPLASDNSGSVAVTCSPPSGSFFPCGTNIVTCVAEDRCGNKEVCRFTIIVRPTGTPPSVECPPDLVIQTCTNGAIVIFPAPVATPAGTTLTCNPPSGSFFPLGSHAVTCIVSNACGTAQCSFKVEIRPVPPPTILCPTNPIVVTLPCGSNCVPVTYSAPTVSNGTLAGCSPPSGTCLPAGVHTITCVATNLCGDRDICRFEVRVIKGPGQPPVIRCPTNVVTVTIPCGSNCVPVFYPLPFVANGVLVECNPPRGTCLPVGLYNVICRASNACDSAECEFLLRVVASPGQPPVLQCPTNLIINTVSCGSDCVPISYPLPTVQNGALAGCTPPPGTCLPVGFHTVTCVATNDCSETKCEFRIEVRPGPTAPILQCPTNTLIFRMPCHSNCVPVNYPLPTVSNGVLVGCNPPPGTCLPLGDYVIRCLATNACGETKCEFRVRVLPLEPVPPSILCPSNITVSAPCGSNCVPVFYPLPVVNNGALAGCNPPPGTCFPIGVTTVNCRATNACGLVSECKFDVRVIPGQGQEPALRCPTNFTVALPCGSNCVPVFYPLPVVTNGVLIACNPPPGKCLPAGNHLITCFASNACGTASCEFIVTVTGQSAPPVIRCPSNIVVSLPCGSNCVPVFYPPPVVVNGVLAECSLASGRCLPVGLYNVKCRATNDCGQSAMCEFQIRVIQGPGEPPVIRCTDDMVVTAPCDSNCVPVFYPAPFVLNGALESCNPPPGTCLPVGTNFITCRATNNCGASLCTFRVIVVRGPGQGPTITCPTNFIAARVPCGSNCVPVFYPPPVISNGVLVKCDPPPGTCLPVGDHVVTCTASNECGRSVCEFVVRVVAGQGHPPLINCPSNITVETCSPDCQTVNYPLPAVFNGALAGCNPPPGSCFPIGLSTVTCLATNACGTNICTFTVRVRPAPYPVIQCPSNITVTTCGDGEIVNYPRPVILGGASNVTVFCTPPSGSFFPVGTHLVRCCVVDRCQRTNCCEFLVIVRPSNPCVKPPAGMVLWLPFDEVLPPVAANIIPGAPNGLHINGPGPLPGQYVVNSLGFDGGNDFVRVPNYAAIMLNASDLSIDAWVRRGGNDPGRRVLVSKVGQVAGAIGLRGYEYYLNNGVMNLALGGVVPQNFNSGVMVPADGNWHHVAVTVRRGGFGLVRFYLDGAIVNAAGGPITLPLGNNRALFVGAGTFPVPNGFFRGQIDEVEIFNRALTPVEVSALWNAHRAGKCKITCAIRPIVHIQTGNCVTVNARLCNNNAVPQTIHYEAGGPAIVPPQSGSVTLPPFTCTTIPILLCRPANLPPNATSPWTLSVSSETQCPMVCTGLVVNHGISVTGPDGPTGLPGTNRTGTVRLDVAGLPSDVPLRLRAIGPDMEPDLQYVSLNGLPPGVPWILEGVSGGAKSARKNLEDGLDVSVRFSDADPVGLYTILVEADLDGDGIFEPLNSFSVENTVVTPPTIRLVNGVLEWDDMGDGLGTLESAETIDGPWSPVPGGPGTPLDTGGPMKFYRIAVPLAE